MPKLGEAAKTQWDRRRREAKKLVVQLLDAGQQAERIALVCGATVAAVYRWKAGTSAASEGHLKQLRRMARWRRT